jgi:hypothetical protein
MAKISSDILDGTYFNERLMFRTCSA